MNPMYDCSGRLDRFGGMTEPPDDYYFSYRLHGQGQREDLQMSTPKCEMCGREIPNAKNRQKFCHDCVKKRQAAQSHKSYLKHREHYLERSLAQAEHRKQEALKEKMLEELLLAKRPEPKYNITQVVKKAKDLGISYGWCSYLLSVGKVCME